MKIDKVRDYLKQFGVENRIIELEESTKTVPLAAQALHCTEGEIAKTLSFQTKDKTILIVAAGDVKIDNAKYRLTFNEKAKMLSMDEVEEKIGYPVGGVCPFHPKEGVEIYLDVSLQKYDIVYPACGSSNSAIGLTIEELQTYSKAKGWIDVCKYMNQETIKE